MRLIVLAAGREQNMTIAQHMRCIGKVRAIRAGGAWNDVQHR